MKHHVDTERKYSAWTNTHTVKHVILTHTVTNKNSLNTEQIRTNTNGTDQPSGGCRMCCVVTAGWCTRRQTEQDELRSTGRTLLTSVCLHVQGGARLDVLPLRTGNSLFTLVPQVGVPSSTQQGDQTSNRAAVMWSADCSLSCATVWTVATPQRVAMCLQLQCVCVCVCHSSVELSKPISAYLCALLLSINVKVHCGKGFVWW